MQLDGGLRFKEADFWRKTKRLSVEKFLTQVLHDNGNNPFFWGDLNTRHSTWDHVCNERSCAVQKV